jgi:hypothetical protein
VHRALDATRWSRSLHGDRAMRRCPPTTQTKRECQSGSASEINPLPRPVWRVTDRHVEWLRASCDEPAMRCPGPERGGTDGCPTVRLWRRSGGTRDRTAQEARIARLASAGPDGKPRRLQAVRRARPVAMATGNATSVEVSSRQLRKVEQVNAQLPQRLRRCQRMLSRPMTPRVGGKGTMFSVAVALARAGRSPCRLATTPHS